MIVTITIDCETEDHLFMHMKRINRKLREELKRQNGEFTEKKVMEDHNCYGDHQLIIDPNE